MALVALARLVVAALAESGRGPRRAATRGRRGAGRPTRRAVTLRRRPTATGDATLRGIPAIRHFFRTNETPIYFVSATAFNLLGIDRWVRNFKFINYFDSFDGWHPNVFAPKEQEPREFTSIEEICNYLLGHKEVVDYVNGRGPGGKVAFLMFDEETEELAEELGLEVVFPSAELRHRMDSKIETTRLGNEAGVPSVPNVMGRGTDYADLLALARGAGLGDDLVVQTPYGDSGQTTFFVAERGRLAGVRGRDRGPGHQGDEADRAPRAGDRGRDHAPRNAGGTADDGAHRLPGAHPVRRRVVRQRRVRPTSSPRRSAPRRASGRRRWASACARRGTAATSSWTSCWMRTTGELWLGELNPRVTGASSITNVTAVAYGDMPLFLFHLLEFMDVDYEIDVDELNERWAHPGNVDEWTQFILKQTDDAVELITEAPSSGIWRMAPDGTIGYARRDTDWHTVADDAEAFYLRIASTGGYRYPGADLGILVTRGRFMDDEHELLDRARDPGSPGSRASSAACRRPSASRGSSPSRSGSRCLAERCRWFRSRSAPSRSSSWARSGPPCSRSAGRTTAPGSCARARRPGPPTPRACGCCGRTCPS